MFWQIIEENNITGARLYSKIKQSTEPAAMLFYAVQESLPKGFKSTEDILSILESLKTYNGTTSIITLDPESAQNNKPASKLINALYYMKENDSNENADQLSKLIDVLQYMSLSDKNDDSNKSKLLNVLQYMKDNDSNENTDQLSKLNDVLQYMLTVDNSNNTSTDPSNKMQWRFKCFKKKFPSITDKEHQYDLYRPINQNGEFDDELIKQLQSINIDYFAFQYTTQPLNTIQQVLSMPGSPTKYNSNPANCKFMAFDKDNKPLTEFGVLDCTLRRGNSKNEFVLEVGHDITLATPKKKYSLDEFKKIVYKQSKANLKELTTDPQLKPYNDIILEIIYNDLSQSTAQKYQNHTYADILAAQLISGVDQYIVALDEVCGYAMTNLLPNILKQQNENTQQQPTTTQPTTNQQPATSQSTTTTTQPTA